MFDPTRSLLTPVQRLELEFKTFNDSIRGLVEGYPLYKDGSEIARVSRVIWRGHIDSPIPCYFLVTGGLLDIKDSY